MDCSSSQIDVKTREDCEDVVKMTPANTQISGSIRSLICTD
jgi:hypothetical protein